jgi:hypothetical protein
MLWLRAWKVEGQAALRVADQRRAQAPAVERGEAPLSKRLERMPMSDARRRCSRKRVELVDRQRLP